MPLLQILMVLVAVGVLLWLVDQLLPMQGTIKSILNGVVVIATAFVASKHFRAVSFAISHSGWGLSRLQLMDERCVVERKQQTWPGEERPGSDSR
jgi:hypothetical protein